MPDDWKAGLDDQDELSQFPSAASPLTAMGIDPDTVRGNPDLLNQLSRAGGATHTSVPTVPNLGGSSNARPTEAPAASVSQPPTEKAQPSTQPEDLGATGRKGLGLLTQNLESATKAASEVPTQEPAEIATLEQTRGKLATPAPRFDPATGKQLTQTQEYDPTTGQEISLNPKASTGRKIWRGVRGGLVGFLTGGIPGAAVGAIEPQDIRGGEAYNAPSPAYQKAEQRREEQLAATDKSLDEARGNWKQAVDAAGKKASEYRANAAMGKDIVSGAKDLMTAENKPDKEDKAAISQKEFEQRGQQADRLGLKGSQRTLFIANGKLPDPRQPTEGEMALTQATQAFVRQNGRAPQTLEEINQVNEAARGTLGKGAGKNEPTEQQLKQVEDKKDDAIKKANEEFAKRMYMPGAKEQYQRQLQAVQDQYEADMSIFGRAGTHNVVAVDPKGKVTWTPQAAPAPVAPPAPAAPPAGGPAAPAAPATKPQPAPDGTRRQNIKTKAIEVKRNGQWVTENAAGQ